MSLRLRLLLYIGISLTALWTLVATWMLIDARQSLREALDNRLAASARMVAGLVSQFPDPRDMVSMGDKPLDVIARDGVACEVSLVRSEVVLRTVARTAGSPELMHADLGFSTHTYGHKRWRTYVLRQGDVQIATADSIDVREGLLKELILSAGVPFAVALFGTLIVLWLGITRGLAPVERIRSLLARRRPGDDSPLPEVDAPIELQPLLQTIEQLLERLQDAIVRERRFTDSAAHELRTPLTGVKTHIQVARLALQQRDASTTEDALASADQGVRQLQNILQRLLDLARLESPAIAGEVSDPSEAISSAIEALKAMHGDAVGRISVQGSECAPPVRVAQPLLAGAIQNLLDNALRYAPAGSPITVALAPQGNETLQISVLDTGAGLNAQERAQAVGRFWRGDPKIPGNGLGLSIVHTIARRHAGAFELLAREGGGLEARLTLPVVDDTAFP